MNRRRAPFTRKRSNKGGALDQAQHRAILERAVDTSMVIGLDPDCKNVGLCGWRPRLDYPGWVATTHVPAEWSAQQAGAEVFRQCFRIFSQLDLTYHRPLIVVEAMRIRRAQSDAATKNPQSLVDVSFCGGMAAGAALAAFPGASLIVVEPQTWKGTIKKRIHHHRLLMQLGWPFESLEQYCRPVNPTISTLSKVNKGDWKHVMDGLGLAKWGREQLALTAARMRRQGRL